MTAIETVTKLIESTKVTLEQVESQKAATITNTQGAEDEAAMIEWATLNTRAQFLARYLEHLEGAAMKQAKADRVSVLLAEVATLYPHHLEVWQGMRQAQDNFAKLRDLIRMPNNEHVFIERENAFNDANAAYGASQKTLLVLREQVLSLGGAFELPL